MKDIPREKLEKLRRWGSQQKGMYYKIYRSGGSELSRERAFGEMNVCVSFIERIEALLQDDNA
jgi:hypothetical protein